MTSTIDRFASAEHDLPEESLCVVTPDGTLVAGSEMTSVVTPELCINFYRDMVLARRFDQEAYHLQRQGELGLWLSCQGQEGAQVGSIRAVEASDHVFPAYREHAAALCRGITPSEMLSQWRGTSHGAWDPATYRFHLYSLVLATQLLHATGYAVGVKADRSDEIVLAYFGDGSASQGDANEAFNWAAVTNVPIVFFCQNNQWAISTPSSAQSRTPLHVRARGFGLSSLVVDGNDVFAVYAATKMAAASVRAGGPPALVEAITYRMQGHSTSDDPRRYRSDDEYEIWRSRDPIQRIRVLARGQGWIDDEFERALEEEADQLANQARTACLALKPTPLEETFVNTLVTETSLLRSEREAFIALEESYE